MFSKLAIFAVASFAAFVAAMPSPDSDPVQQCGSGSVQCCNSIAQSGDEFPTYISKIFSFILPENTAVGLSCIPIDHSSGVSCSSQSVCCQNNNFGGVIAIDCSPITIINE